MYSVVVYSKIGNDVLMVDKTWCDSEEDADAFAHERKSNNPEYIVVKLSYKLESASIIS